MLRNLCLPTHAPWPRLVKGLPRELFWKEKRVIPTFLTQLLLLPSASACPVPPPPPPCPLQHTSLFSLKVSFWLFKATNHSPLSEGVMGRKYPSLNADLGRQGPSGTSEHLLQALVSSAHSGPGGNDSPREGFPQSVRDGGLWIPPFRGQGQRAGP